MLRINNLKRVLVTVESFPITFTNLQCLRWRRKPRWLPVAKSKQFLVPPRTITPEDEAIEMKRLFNNYRTQMKAIRSYLHSEYNVKSVSVDTEAHEKEFLEDFKACSAINDVWNAEIRVMQEARRAKELEEAKNIAYQRIDERTRIQKDRLESVEEIVRKEKAASKNFITPENLDAAIEYALANPIDYNYSIDLDGNVYKGRTTKPEVIKTEKS